MDFDTKVAHRKSRAPWQSNAVKSNPYAKANSSYTEGSQQGGSLQVPGKSNPYGMQSSMLFPGNGTSSKNRTPSGTGAGPGGATGGTGASAAAASGGSGGGGPAYSAAGGGPAGPGGSDYLTPNTASNRKASRRMSIHASAAAANRNRGGYDPLAPTVPLVPQLYRTTTNQSAILTGTTQQRHQAHGDEVGSRIMGDLAGGTAAEIDEYYKVLTKQRAVVTRDIKDNINENQKNILELTNDLKDTQDELLQLRVTTRDLYEILDDFKDAAQRRIELENDTSSQHNSRLLSSSGSQKASKRKDRSSIIYLEKMWNDQLQSLFKHVEGASKFIQPIPGRHILAESGRWSEINVGNWKIVKPAHLFILNDVILIATKKYTSNQDTPATPSASNTPRSSTAYNSNNNTNNSSANNSKSKLQAVLCWPLHDVKFSEIAAPSLSNRTGKVDENKTYSINLKSNSMSYIYQTDRYDHFVKILEAFKKGQHELIQKERAFERANEENRRRRSVGRRGDDEDKKLLRDSIRNSGIIEDNEDAASSISKSKSMKRLSADVMLQDISAKVHSRNRSHDFKNGSPKLGSSSSGAGAAAYFNDLKRIEDRIDEVDVEIAHNKFMESVGLIRYIENKIFNIEASLEQGAKNRQLLQEQDDNLSATILEDEIKLLIEVINIKIGSRKVKIQKNLIFELQHNITILQGDEISQIMEFFYNFDQLEKGVTAYLQSMSHHLNVTASKLVVGIQGSTKIDVVNYLSNMVIIYVSIVKRTIYTYKEFILPVLNREQNKGTGDHVVTIDSSGLIDWCTEQMSRLVSSIKKHLYGTLVTTSSHDSVTDEPFYKIKDIKLFNEFISIIKPKLDELKGVGVNLDFLFQDIFLLKYA